MDYTVYAPYGANYNEGLENIFEVEEREQAEINGRIFMAELARSLTGNVSMA